VTEKMPNPLKVAKSKYAKYAKKRLTEMIRHYLRPALGPYCTKVGYGL